MTISMYQASVPVLLRALDNLVALLAKGRQHAEARGIDPLVLTAMRLTPDMYPLRRQVQIACDVAKGGAARLAGLESPPKPDIETTFDELIARIEWTTAYLRRFDAEQIDGSETRPVSMKTPFGELHFSGQQYLLGFVLPNVFFHVTTTYNLLRHAGVELGKRDFLGPF